MLTFFNGEPERYCDGMSRRSFLKAGGLTLGGLALLDLLRLRAEGAVIPEGRGKSVIMICLGGGPSHVDTYDMKPGAPAEIRGEFKPIATRVPGIQICEHLPLLAKMMDKLVLVRSLVGAEDRHDAVTCLTGRSPRRLSTAAGGRPAPRVRRG